MKIFNFSNTHCYNHNKNTEYIKWLLADDKKFIYFGTEGSGSYRVNFDNLFYN